MKKILTEQDILSVYIESGEILNNPNVDYKTCNKEGEKVIKVFKQLEKDIELAKSTLPQLFNHPNVATRSNAAAHCISLGIYINEAVDVLERVSVDKTIGIYRLNAEMTLKVWREQGYLHMYQKKKK